MIARKSTFNRMVKIMLTLCGAWPGLPYVIFCRIFWTVSMIFAMSCNCRYFLSHIHSAELIDLVDCLCLFLAHCKVFTKCITFWLHRRKFSEVLVLIEEDWGNCANDDISLREMTSKANTSDRITNTIIIIHTITIIGYAIGIILLSFEVDVTDKTKELPFFTKSDFPIEVNTLRTYRIMLVTEFCFLMLCAWTAGITNSLLLSLTLHAAGQIDIICYWLTRLLPSENKDKQKSITNKIIQKHQRIISFSENIERLYTCIALVQFMSNTIMICSLGFLIIRAIGDQNAVEQIVRSLVFYTITNLEAFIFCYAGEYLTNKCKEIGFAAYNSAWYDLKPSDSRLLLFIMLRSQKNVTLTVGKMMDLSLETFTRIMNASGSYLSVLLAME